MKDRAAALGNLAAGVLLVLVPWASATSGRRRFPDHDVAGGDRTSSSNHEGATGRYLPLVSGHETYEFGEARREKPRLAAAGTR